MDDDSPMLKKAHGILEVVCPQDNQSCPWYFYCEIATKFLQAG